MTDGDLCTLAQVRTYLGVADDDTAGDALLAQLITAVSTSVRSALGTALLADDYDERYTGTGAAVLVLRRAPVQAVYQVTIDGEAVARIAGENGDGYLLDGRALYLRGRTFQSQALGVRVRYRAGYEADDAIPADLAQLVVEETARAFKEPERIGVTSKTLAGEVISYSMAAFSERSRVLLGKYTEVVPA